MQEKLVKETYYIAENLERYLNYANKKPFLDSKEIIKSVNCNIDYDFYTHLKKVDLTKKNLILVNKYYQLENIYEPNDLILIPNKYGNGISKLTKEAQKYFVKMARSALRENIAIIGLSGYRSCERQRKIYEESILENGIFKTDKASARPGHSEHQTGLAIDVNLINSSFAKTKEFRWLEKNSYRYGFILRYPKSKEYLTGYKFEPWHYRYVGISVAKFIYEKNITFEEYYAYYIENKN